MDHLLSHLNPVHILALSFTIVLPSTSRSSNWILLVKFADKKFIRIYLCSVFTTHTASFIVLYPTYPIPQIRQQIKWRASLYNFLHPPAFTPLWVPNIPLCTLFLNEFLWPRRLSCTPLNNNWAEFCGVCWWCAAFRITEVLDFIQKNWMMNRVQKVNNCNSIYGHSVFSFPLLNPFLYLFHRRNYFKQCL
jgi:hypothetical protein